MSIILVEYPRATLQDQTDYAKQNALIEALNLASSDRPIDIDLGTSKVLKGNIFQIGGAVYRVTADETITGSASFYVKITPSGATATASYVANITGVTWSDIYNGYYDGSGNLYIFDEGRALVFGYITVRKKRNLSFSNVEVWFKNGEILTHTSGGVAVGLGAAVTEKGFAGGAYSSATTGGASGYNADTTTGGAVGAGAQASDGFAGGQGAIAASGGAAIGVGAYATTGGAVGSGAYSQQGFAGGNGAASVGDSIAIGENTQAEAGTINLLNKLFFANIPYGATENYVWNYYYTKLTANDKHGCIGRVGSTIIESVIVTSAGMAFYDKNESQIYFIAAGSANETVYSISMFVIGV